MHHFGETLDILKSACIKFIADNKIKIVGYRELNLKNLSAGNFELCLLSNNCVIHTITLDYHLKILSISTTINDSNLSKSTFADVSALIEFCNETRRGIGYEI